VHAHPAPSRSRRVANHARTSALLLVGLLVLSGIGLAATPPARAASASSTSVTIMATDSLSFVPNSISVTTRSVELEVENVGTVGHTFTLSARVNQTAPSDTNTSTNASGTFFASNEVLVDDALPAGQTIFVNVTLPSLGSYEFICRIHFPDMVGTLTLNAPSPASSSSTPWYLYGGIVVVLLVAVVVIAAVARRRRRPPVAPTAPKTA